MKLLKQFEKIFFISLVVIISVSCSSRSKELSSALRKHKNEYGVDNILTLIREKDLESALYESAIAGYSDIVSGLVKYGANIDYRGGDGDTLLMSFCKNGNIEAAKILIENGADVSITDYNGKTIFDNIKNSKDKRDLISYMNRGKNI
ncbi:ankyrin repeat domain-containing protein [Brachyspira aalborgi]|uniref:ankyrin repeat domain-containing protein n=1 Tax=Brachyspira aalborgi TaxID=29522 RepID=UPI00266703E6|nr:ankyrin repeat domain-containing protein [Brachyspira aalborgi]